MPEHRIEREGVPHNNTNYMRGCRCSACQADHAFIQAEGVIKRRDRLNELPAEAHGRLSTFTNWGCRCPQCSDASVVYHRERRALKKAVASRAHETSVTGPDALAQPQNEMVCDLGFTHIVVEEMP